MSGVLQKRRSGYTVAEVEPSAQLGLPSLEPLGCLRLLFGVAEVMIWTQGC